MRSATFLIGTAVVFAICCAIVSRAGDLNPPQGAIAPSMHTIDELYTLMGEQNPNRPWQSIVIESLGGSSTEDLVVLPAGTSGVVHAMHFRSGDSFDCLEMDPESLPLFSFETPGTAFITLPLDVQYSNGLRMRARSGAWGVIRAYTIFYREDIVISPPSP